MSPPIQISLSFKVPAKAIKQKEFSNLIQVNSVFLFEFFLQSFIIKGLEDNIIVSLNVFPVVKKGIGINKEARMTMRVLVFLVILQRIRYLRGVIIIVRIILIILVIVVIIIRRNSHRFHSSIIGTLLHDYSLIFTVVIEILTHQKVSCGLISSSNIGSGMRREVSRLSLLM